MNILIKLQWKMIIEKSWNRRMLNKEDDDNGVAGSKVQVGFLDGVNNSVHIPQMMVRNKKQKCRGPGQLLLELSVFNVQKLSLKNSRRAWLGGMIRYVHRVLGLQREGMRGQKPQGHAIPAVSGSRKTQIDHFLSLFKMNSEVGTSRPPHSSLCEGRGTLHAQLLCPIDPHNPITNDALMPPSALACLLKSLEKFC